MAAAASVLSMSSTTLIRAVEAEAIRMIQAPGNVLAGCSGAAWGHAAFRPLPGLGCTRLDCRAPARVRKARLAFPVCLLQGLGGPFWDGADAADNSSSSVSNDHFQAKKGYNRKKEKMVLLSLVQQIEPLDVSNISKDASADSMDAMKRTISGMLGLLPSDQFKVTIEAYREPLARLLVSSMMTGYTLRNAEYRLCLQRSLQLSEEDAVDTQATNDSEHQIEPSEETGISDSIDSNGEIACAEQDFSVGEEKTKGLELPEKIGFLTPEAEDYISQLQAKLIAMEKDLEDCKRAKTALEMEKIVGDEKNDLLDYLRSLEPDKVAELSHPTSAEVEEVIQIVIDGLLDNLCKLRPSKSSPFSGGSGPIASSWDKSSSPELQANLPLQFQSTVTATRDYLARLLFWLLKQGTRTVCRLSNGKASFYLKMHQAWCMLLGHHMRGLEYRLELSHALSLSAGVELGVED